jgi:hypothetical protein
MRVSMRGVTWLGFALALSVACVGAACGSPAAPTVQTAASAAPAVTVPTGNVPPGPPVAVLAVEGFTLTLVSNYGNQLVPSFQLAETSGRSAAVVISVEFNLADGAPWGQPTVWYVGRRVAAAGAAAIEPDVIYGDSVFTFDVPAGYAGRVSALVVFADEQGRRGTVTALAAVPR